MTALAAVVGNDYDYVHKARVHYYYRLSPNESPKVGVQYHVNLFVTCIKCEYDKINDKIIELH